VKTRLRQQIRAGCALAGALALVTLAGGCGGQPKALVSGTVTLDGVPLETGTIQFYPVNGKGQSAGAGIQDGKYTGEASVGEMTVIINSSKVVGKQKMYDTPDSPVFDKVAELIPAKYNTISELKVTLKDGTNDGVNFELTSGKKK
jgi:hypothetical protein